MATEDWETILDQAETFDNQHAIEAYNKIIRHGLAHNSSSFERSAPFFLCSYFHHLPFSLFFFFFSPRWWRCSGCRTD
jgi:hypothetical protein